MLTSLVGADEAVDQRVRRLTERQSSGWGSPCRRRSRSSVRPSRSMIRAATSQLGGESSLAEQTRALCWSISSLKQCGHLSR